MFKPLLLSALLATVLIGCGTDNPFERGPDFDDGSIDMPAPGEQFSFAADVKPILNACVGCHASGTGGWTYDGGADAYSQTQEVVNTNDPENSPLLVKGSGGDGHGGGTLFTGSSAEYTTLLQWIQDGAPDN